VIEGLNSISGMTYAAALSAANTTAIISQRNASRNSANRPILGG
jgi:hypothetical protein